MDKNLFLMYKWPTEGKYMSDIFTIKKDFFVGFYIWL